MGFQFNNSKYSNYFGLKMTQFVLALPKLIISAFSCRIEIVVCEVGAQQGVIKMLIIIQEGREPVSY